MLKVGSLGWNFEQNIRNVETCEEDIVIVSFKTKIFLQACKLGISNVGSLKVESGRKSVNLGRLLCLACSKHAELLLLDIKATHVDEAEKVENGDGGNNI